MARSALGFELTPPSRAETEQLARNLDPESRRILLGQGTEAPFCGGFVDNADDGVYVCGLCGLPLFTSSAKFHSGSGWPSFYAPLNPDHIANIKDLSHGMVRVENRCARCGAHLGHVFEDGPRPTGLRYCLNSAALRFVAAGAVLPDLLARGTPEGAAFIF
ncbi:MAG: peptide-methionine (R)-S-oxide reductase MsrB [Rhizomicrobium sp.]